MNGAAPLQLIIFSLSIVGAISDWKYKQKRGKTSSRKAKIIFIVLLLLWAASFAFLFSLPLKPETEEQFVHGAAGLVTMTGVWLFGAWECYRWRVRKKNPIPLASLR